MGIFVQKTLVLNYSRVDGIIAYSLINIVRYFLTIALIRMDMFRLLLVSTRNRQVRRLIGFVAILSKVVV